MSLLQVPAQAVLPCVEAKRGQSCGSFMRAPFLLCLVLVGVVTAVGCKASTDANTSCVLVKGLPDGGTATLTNRDLTMFMGANHDFISFGSTECDDQICVRDSQFQDDGGLEQPAHGYCSHPCISGQNCPSQDSSLDKKVATKLTCRALLLDSATLAAICAGDAGMEECIRNFGGNTTPFFCARGTSPDAGN